MMSFLNKNVVLGLSVMALAESSLLAEIKLPLLKQPVGPFIEKPEFGDGFMECGQSCLYHKAIEDITYMVVLAREKLEDLGRLSKPDIIETLGEFCMEGAQGVRESASNCRDRYTDIIKMWLFNARAALALNSDHIVALKDVSTGEYGELKFDILRALKNPPLQPQKPYFYTWEDLKEIAKTIQPLVMNDYVSWVASLPTEPHYDEFILTKEIPRDPKNKDLGSLTVIDRHPNGEPKHDEPAYRAALKVYKGSFSDRMIAAQKNMLTNSERQRVQKVFDKRNLANHSDSDQYFDSRKTNPQGAAIGPDKNHQYVNDSRGLIVKAINDQMAQKQATKKGSKEIVDMLAKKQTHFTGTEQVNPVYSTGQTTDDSTSVYLRGPTDFDWYKGILGLDL